LEWIVDWADALYWGWDLRRCEMELVDVFPFEYQGGGYFRRKGVPVGQKAEILHGEQAIRYLFNAMSEPASLMVPCDERRGQCVRR
jgi:hypothetical protein